MIAAKEVFLMALLAFLTCGSTSENVEGFVAIHLENPKEIQGSCVQPGEMFPDSLDCSVFFVCEGSPPEPVPYMCLNSIPFNPSTNKCDPEYDCGIVSQCFFSGQQIPNPDDCASYIKCSSALKPIVIHCEEGQFYSEELKGCRDPNSVKCTPRPGCTYAGEAFANYQDCHSFYRCNGVLAPVKYYCQSGQSYDANSNRCVPTSQAKCAGTGTTVTLGTTATTKPNTGCTTPGQKLPNLDDDSCKTYFICDAHLETTLWKCAYGEQFDDYSLKCKPCEYVTCRH